MFPDIKKRVHLTFTSKNHQITTVNLLKNLPEHASIPGAFQIDWALNLFLPYCPLTFPKPELFHGHWFDLFLPLPINWSPTLPGTYYCTLDIFLPGTIDWALNRSVRLPSCCLIQLGQFPLSVKSKLKRDL